MSSRYSMSPTSHHLDPDCFLRFRPSHPFLPYAAHSSPTLSYAHPVRRNMVQGPAQMRLV
eukprot:3301012-Rhodomonas_salina.1